VPIITLDVSNGFGLGLWLRLAADRISVSRLNSGGNRKDVPIQGSPKVWRPMQPGCIVSIKPKEKGGTSTPGLEFWTGVSLLHSNGKGTAGDFDFNLLFYRRMQAIPWKPCVHRLWQP
jgi:hypothetical protein